MPISPIQIRDEMLAYLVTPGFTFFVPVDVIDYTGMAQIWVKCSPAQGCDVRMIYNYSTGKNTLEFIQHNVDASQAFYAELETIAMFWGQTVADNTVE